MPYIKQDRRKELDPAIDVLSKILVEENNVGDYNYAITRLIHNFVRSKGVKYKNLSAAKGILNDAVDEFNRVVMSPYEDQKIKENGNISELDEK